MILACATIGAAHADLHYRLHRYDSFMAIPPAELPGKQIMFIGNSITNMHNWNEAFGSDPHVVNRGNSGAYVSEFINEVEYLLDSKPARVFIGIGTNDLAAGRSPRDVANDVRTLIERIRALSPTTEIVVQSILPRSKDDVWHKIEHTLPLLRDICPKPGATFIDLTNTMSGVRVTIGENPDESWSPDGLHPSGIAYRAWCDQIKGLVNGSCSYSDGAYHPDITTISNPSRISQFSLLPVNENDILFVGDEMVEGGEWHELLRLPQIKKRSNGYGHDGISLCGVDGAKDIIKASLTTDTLRQKSPSKILIYCGEAEMQSEMPAADYMADYLELVDYIRHIAPSTRIYLISLIDADNGSSVNTYNAVMQEMVANDRSLTYIDIYSELKANAANSMRDGYVNGRGYVRIANIIARYLAEDGAMAVTIDDFEKYYADRKRRKTHGQPSYR